MENNREAAAVKSYEYKEIESVSEFIRCMEELMEQYDMDNNYKEYFAFRGQSSSSYELAPSLARSLKNRGDVKMLNFEQELIFKAINEYPTEFLKAKSEIDLLVKLQHYGIPTRLLDITTNALIALFFACCSKENDEGEVFVFKLMQRNNPEDHYMANAVASTYLYELEGKSIQEYYQLIREKYGEIGISYDTEESDGFYDFRQAYSYVYENQIVVQPPKDFDRIRIQEGQFLLFANSAEYDDNMLPSEILSEIRPMEKTSRNIVQIFRIPANAKSKIIKGLLLLGITKGSLFHDSIDIVFEEIVNDIKNRK